MKRMLAAGTIAVALGLLGTPSAHADSPSCGPGTYLEPSLNTCLPLSTPTTPYPYNPNWSQFCFNGFWFSYCTGTGYGY